MHHEQLHIHILSNPKKLFIQRQITSETPKQPNFGGSPFLNKIVNFGFQDIKKFLIKIWNRPGLLANHMLFLAINPQLTFQKYRKFCYFRAHLGTSCFRMRFLFKIDKKIIKNDFPEYLQVLKMVFNQFWIIFEKSKF